MSKDRTKAPIVRLDQIGFELALAEIGAQMLNLWATRPRTDPPTPQDLVPDDATAAPHQFVAGHLPDMSGTW